MINFLTDILKFNSTSGSENELVKFISEKYKTEFAEMEIQETEEKRLNLLFKIGEPKIIFCSHLDTVSPYIAPERNDDSIFGRGSCDAKGQVAYLFEVFKQLANEGYSDIGMLMVSGEEDGSQGAIRANKNLKNCNYIFIGEPTENKLIKASKGNLLLNLKFLGQSAHSGYPGKGDSALTRMLTFFNNLNSLSFPVDDLLGETTYNIGKINSSNAHNVIPDFIEMKMFIRTTFESDKNIIEKIKSVADDKVKIEFVYGDKPIIFCTVDGYETDIAAYGTDAPSFTNVKNKILYGPGSILDAHTDHEKIKIKDLFKAVEDVKNIYKKIINEN